MGQHVLVVEDDLTVQRLLESTLVQSGYEVTVASDGLDGLVKLQGGVFDLLICDALMPRLSGLDLIRAIKSRQETKRVPVIVLTARTDSRAIIDGINAGARFLVAKPVVSEELLDKVRRALPAEAQLS